MILKIPENVKYIRLSTDSGLLDNIKVYPIVNKKVTNYTNQNIKIEDSILNSENIIDDYYIHHKKIPTQDVGTCMPYSINPKYISKLAKHLINS